MLYKCANMGKYALLGAFSFAWHHQMRSVAYSVLFFIAFDSLWENRLLGIYMVTFLQMYQQLKRITWPTPTVSIHSILTS